MEGFILFIHVHRFRIPIVAALKATQLHIRRPFDVAITGRFAQFPPALRVLGGAVGNVGTATTVSYSRFVNTNVAACGFFPPVPVTALAACRLAALNSRDGGDPRDNGSGRGRAIVVFPIVSAALGRRRFPTVPLLATAHPVRTGLCRTFRLRGTTGHVRVMLRLQRRRRRLRRRIVPVGVRRRVHQYLGKRFGGRHKGLGQVSVRQRARFGTLAMMAVGRRARRWYRALDQFVILQIVAGDRRRERFMPFRRLIVVVDQVLRRR